MSSPDDSRDARVTNRPAAAPPSASAAPSFPQLVAENERFIRAALGRLGVRANDMDDTAQEVLIAAHRHLPDFDPSRSPRAENAIRTWLFVICRRWAANRIRRAQRCAEVVTEAEALEDHADDSPHAEDAHLAKERRLLLADLLAEVSSERRAVLVAYRLEEIPLAEVAASMGIPQNTAWNRLRLGIADLRAAWLRRLARDQRGLPRRSR